MEFDVKSPEDVLKTFAADEVLSDFLNDEFNIQDYATQVIENAAISQRLAQLLDGISMLDKELQSQISSRHEDLLAQATGIESLEGVLTMMQTRINSLQAAVDRIRSKVGEPFNKIQARTIQLGRLQITCDLLRRIVRIQRLSKRLHSQLQGGVRELTKAAQSLSELDYLSQGVDLSGIEVMESDRIFIQRAKEEVTSQAIRLLDQGIATLNQTHTATALQVFYNLGSLQFPIARACQEATNSTRQNIKTALDIKVIQKRSTSVQNVKGGPGKASGMPTPGNSALFRANLWNNIEVLTDQIAASTNQMIHLYKVLSKKRDPVTHARFIEEPTKNIGEIDFVKKFWETLTSDLEKELVSSANASSFVKQAFEGEYPKLLRLYNELWIKLHPHRDIIQASSDQLKAKSAEQDMSTFSKQISEDQPTNDYNGEKSLKRSLHSFETAYLQRSISRLFDPINLVFPQGGRSAPSNDEMEAIVKTVSSEMSVASVDEGLGVTVARNIAKTVQLFAVKSEQLISTQGEASQVIGVPTTAQQRNVEVVNSLYSLQSSVLKLVDEQHMLSEEAVDIIRSSCEKLSLLMAATIQPLVSSVADSVEAIILTMHNEDFTQEAECDGETTLCSLYMKELRDFITRVVRDHFKLIQCQDFVMESLQPLGHRCIELFVRHASLVRPITEAGKMKLAADFAQMELAVSPLCRRLIDFGNSYRLLRAFRPLLFQSETALADSSSIGDVIPYSTTLEFLFSRAPPNVRSPYQVMEWSIGKYSRWLDEHGSERERLNMIRGAIENYVNAVRSRQETEFAEVYPIMMKLLQRAMDKQASA